MVLSDRLDRVMANHAPYTSMTVRDAETGRIVTVRGAGALKGRLTLRDDIDLTKPIAAQVLANLSATPFP